MAAFVLIHSPLVGPFTWQRVAAELRLRGHRALTPVLTEPATPDQPFWSAHAQAVARAVFDADAATPADSDDQERANATPRGASFGALPAPSDAPLILVAHSGAGPLLPLVRARLGAGVVAGYLFVDAGVPEQTASRLAMLRESDHAPELADQLEAHLAAGGRFPAWRDADLRAILPDDDARRTVLGELRPRAEAFWREALPVQAGWPDAPAAYLLFSTPYAATAERVRRQGWPLRHLAAGHFHMLVDPSTVADALLALAHEIGALPAFPEAEPSASSSGGRTP